MPYRKMMPRNPKTDTRYKEVPDKDLPRTESLKETVERILPYWKCTNSPQSSYSKRTAGSSSRKQPQRNY